MTTKEFHFGLEEEAQPQEVQEPYAVFRFLSQETSKAKVDTYIEDPAVQDFFVVVKILSEDPTDNRCLVYYSDTPGIPEHLRGRYFIARWLDRSGYFFAPYVPLIQTPVVLDPASFSPRKGIITRYGKKLLKQGAQYYAKKTIK